MPDKNTPIFVFIPGAWHTPDTFDSIRAQLSNRQYDSIAIANPSVNAAEPTKFGLHADIAHAKDVLRTLADQGHQIVVVMHSYGGMVGSGAVEGFGYAQRCKAGQPGGVLTLVYLAAFVTPKGKSLYDILGRKWGPWMIFKDPDDGYCRSSQQEAIFYHDLTPEAQATAISKLKPHSKISFLEPATFEPWHEMPCMYFFCDQDAALPPPMQEEFIRILGKPARHVFDTSHSPFLSQPEKVAEALELALEMGRDQCGIH